MNTDADQTAKNKILCVDDAENMLHLFRRTLGRSYDLHTASSGQDALQTIREHGPFMVIMSDYNMPGMTGLTLLQHVKQLSPDTVQILLTGAAELDIAIQAVNEVNVFRYLPKPCPIDALRKVMNDALEQYHLVDSKRRLTEELEKKNQQMAHELEMARIVYNKVLAYGQRSLPGLHSHMASLESVGGDLLLTHLHQDNILYLMLGDLTGHGLPAALATLLVSDVFSEQTKIPCSLETLAKQINSKMCRTLPTGLFCAALLARLDLNKHSIEIWQGGLPDAYLLDKDGRVMQCISSRNLALGVVSDSTIPQTILNFPLENFCSLFVSSDGVTEQLGKDNEMFGAQRLQAALQNPPEGSKRIDQVLQHLQHYQGDTPQSDDIAMLELNFCQLAQAISEASLVNWSI